MSTAIRLDHLDQKEPSLTLQQIGAWGTRIEQTLLATPDAQRDERAYTLLVGLNHAIKQSGRDLSIHPERVLRAIRRYEAAQSAPQVTNEEASPC